MRGLGRHFTQAGRDQPPLLVPAEALGVTAGARRRVLRVGGWPFYVIAALIWLGFLWGESTPGRYGDLLLGLLVPALIVLLWCFGGLIIACVRKRWREIPTRFVPAVVVLAVAIASLSWQVGLRMRVALSAGALRAAVAESQHGAVIHDRRIGLYGVTSIQPAGSGAYIYLHGGGAVKGDAWALAYFPKGKPQGPHIYGHIYGPWYEWTAIPDTGIDR